MTYKGIILFFSILSLINSIHAQNKGNENRYKMPTAEVTFAKPLISPSKSIFTDSLEVTLYRPYSDTSCKKARIYYTIDGSDPRNSPSSIFYVKPFVLHNTSVVKAYITSSNKCLKSGKLLEKEYTLLRSLPVPKISPENGRVAFGQKIGITVQGFEKNSDIQIYYTLDGKDPSTSGKNYKSPFEIYKNCLLKIIAISKTSKFLNSPVFSSHIKCYSELSPIPRIFPESRNFNQMLDISISLSRISKIMNNTVIYYTIDGSEPSSSSKIYKRPFKIKKTTTVRALAISEEKEPSPIVSELYSKGSKPVTPKVIINYGSGTYEGEIPPVVLESQVEKSMILYTTDGTEPTMASTLWNGIPLNLTAPVTLKVKIFKKNQVPSVTTIAHYNYETLPAPIPDIPNGTVFTDNLYITFNVPGFKNLDGINIFYTVDGSNPLKFGMPYLNEVVLSHSSILKAFARRKGYYDSNIIVNEYYNMIKVKQAYYMDMNRDGRIETAILIFNRPILNPPSIIEFTDPYTAEKRKVETVNILLSDQSLNHRSISVMLPEPFSLGGSFFSGHYGRIPLPGEFDTAPFLIHDSTYNSHIMPINRMNETSFNINRIKFNTNNVAVVTNPFIPGKSKLPDFVKYLDDYRSETGTAILINPPHPSNGYGVIYDALGNQVIISKKLVEDPLSGLLVLIWDGNNSEKKPVFSGTYLVVVTIQEKQSSKIHTRKSHVVVKRE